MKRVAGFPLATTALKMSDYQWDSRAPMPFGALLSAGWKLIRAIIGDGLVPPQKCLYLGIGGESYTDSPRPREGSGHIIVDLRVR
jgi:hypothetical protein